MNSLSAVKLPDKVVASAGTVYYLSREEIKRAIRDAGYVPRQRNVFYEYIVAEDRAGAEALAVC